MLHSLNKINIFKTVFLYWNTLRYLRAVQFYARVFFRLYKPLPNLGHYPSSRQVSGSWSSPAQRTKSLIAPTVFFFLGEHGSLDEFKWDGAQKEKLWRYNQHYFDDLNSEDATTRTSWHRDILVDWVLNNKPGCGTGWEPYPTSLRIVNWIKWSLSGNALTLDCKNSLAVQARWLVKRLEVHLLGNHLYANAKALVFAGLYFEGEEASRWLELGMSILARETAEQILQDGGHFERSTMYHSIALEDILDLCNLINCYGGVVPEHWMDLVADWHVRVPKMLTWLHAMCHDDGEISFFNDAAQGIAPPPAELFRYARSLGFSFHTDLPEITHLSDSGYIRISKGPATAILDCARIGPDYLPGHAHADTLSFELSIFGRRVLVNSGTSCYGLSSERLRQRGTAAHNTVVVNGQDSSEVWSGFRVARRARPNGLIISNSTDSECHISCAHDGYRRLHGKPEHIREWGFSGKMFCVNDRVTGSFDHAQAHFLVHPDVAVEVDAGNQEGRLVLPNGYQVNWQVENASLNVVPSTWHPRFGLSLATVSLVLDFHDGCSRIRFYWN